MCINLQDIGKKDEDGQPVLVPCRKCWRCRANRVNDWVGRMLAQKITSPCTVAVTLTYRGNGPNTAVLVYRDFQLFMKRLRKENPDAGLRYLVAGEYGTKKGRAHWHCILFSNYPLKGLPETDLEKQEWPTWGLGFVYVQAPDWRGLSYVLKYILKNEMDASGQKKPMMSKKPPLGHEFFQALALERVQSGLTPKEGYYVEGGKDARGNWREFRMGGATWRNFVDIYAQKVFGPQWVENPRDDWPEALKDWREKWLRLQQKQMAFTEDEEAEMMLQQHAARAADDRFPSFMGKGRLDNEDKTDYAIRMTKLERANSKKHLPNESQEQYDKRQKEVARREALAQRRELRDQGYTDEEIDRGLHLVDWFTTEGGVVHINRPQDQPAAGPSTSAREAADLGTGGTSPRTEYLRQKWGY